MTTPAVLGNSSIRFLVSADVVMRSFDHTAPADTTSTAYTVPAGKNFVLTGISQSNNTQACRIVRSGVDVFRLPTTSGTHFTMFDFTIPFTAGQTLQVFQNQSQSFIYLQGIEYNA